jgi:repressor LexA
VDSTSEPKRKYTAKQGQYLAFIHYYTKMFRRAPSEWEIQEHFRVSPPSVHDMILRLEEQGLIARMPGEARSIRLLLPKEELPDLE